MPGALNHEHIFYIPMATLLELHESAGLELIGRDDFNGPDMGHSHFFAFRKSGQAPRSPQWDHTCIKPAAEKVKQFWDISKRRALALSHVLAMSPIPHFLMPASGYSQTLLAFGLRSTDMACLIDNSTSKQGKRLYGTNLLVKGSREVASLLHGTVIVHGGAHTRDMIAGLLALNPTLTIIDAANY